MRVREAPHQPPRFVGDVEIRGYFDSLERFEDEPERGKGEQRPPPDAEMALRNARDLYTRRQEGVSIWVIPAEQITASSPDEKDSFFEPAGDKIYRHPTFYELPKSLDHM